MATNSEGTLDRLIREQGGTPPTKGLLLPCPKCGEADAVIRLNLAEPDCFLCDDCSEEFSAADVRAFIARWEKVLAWVATIPAGE
jgi:uncharacterized protein (DUF983 family)